MGRKPVYFHSSKGKVSDGTFCCLYLLAIRHSLLVTDWLAQGWDITVV